MNRINKKIYSGILALLITIISILSSGDVNVQASKRQPTTPTNLTAGTITDNSVSLSWGASTARTGNVTYNVYRDSVIVANTASTSYTDTGLSASKTYSYFVRAKDMYGTLSFTSNKITITTKSSVVVTPTPVPTIVPTATPVPTAAPTIAPTVVPTTAPTPTVAPTIAPTATPVPAKASKVVGYYAAWAAYSGFTPDKVDASKLTHINYAFANIGSDLKVTLGYPDVDASNISKLNALKKVNPNLKTLISIGGWSWSSRFSDVALSDASRTVFADSCVNFITQYGFDGVDVDWEYPVSGGLSTNVYRPEDKTNFTLLMQKIREKLSARETIDGKKYLLTFAGGSSASYINNIEATKVAPYVDFANVMTYDAHGTWDKYTDFNEPLYDNTDVSPQYKWSADAGIRVWQNSGFPSSKIIMGVPFYGYLYKAVGTANNGLYQTYSGGQSVSYATLVANYLNAPGYVRYYHSQSMVPWLFDGSTFISYDDAQSMGQKAQYINNKGIGGAMAWELSQDSNNTLLNALYNGLK